MEFVVNKREFVKALSRVQSVADKRSPMPILTNVLIRAEASGAVHFAEGRFQEARDAFKAVLAHAGDDLPDAERVEQAHRSVDHRAR